MLQVIDNQAVFFQGKWTMQHDVLKLIQRLRETLQISDAQIAKKLGMYPSQFNRYVTGVNSPTAKTLSKMAQLLEDSLPESEKAPGDSIKTMSPIEAIEGLKKLLDIGAISKDEYEIKKKELLKRL